ncbi:MAG TPA: glycosyltransferase family 4 protein [Stellaceae bacterium]|nr:glycosyltransferase family 4 protein [Stellaceae bacterium]
MASEEIEAPAPAHRPKRIIFLNRFFFPDHSATSQMLSDLAFHLAATGQAVHVLTSQQRYDDPRARLPESDFVHGVAINRLATTRFGRSSLLGRGFDYLSFYRSVWRMVLAVAQTGDILVAKTDPPLLCIPAMQVAKRRGLRLVNWLQDLYPEIATELGVPFIKGPVAKGLLHLRDTALRSAAANVVVGDRMGEIVRARGISADRVHVIPNWCDDEEIRPVPLIDNALRREWGLQDRFVVGYSGNLGRGHEFETVLVAAEHLRGEENITFLFIGGGNRLIELARLVAERGLDHLFRFVPYQDRKILKLSLGVPDVHWISLKPELEGLIVPSKFYGIAAAGRPVITVTAPNGELARLVLRHGCGIVVEPGAGEIMAARVRDLAQDRSRVVDMGLRARAMLDAQFTRRHAFERWHALLEGIG